MDIRKFKFLLGLMTCAFALSALAPIAAEETTQYTESLKPRLKETPLQWGL